MSAVHPIPIRRFTDDQALAWLAAKSPCTISCAALGRAFGWHRNTVGSKLQSWAATEKIARNGNTIIVQKIVQKKALHNAAQTSHCAAKWPAILLVLIGCTIAFVLLMVNVASWHSFAKGTWLAYLFVALGVAIAVAVMALPACARAADRGTSALLWFLWLFVFLVDLLTSVGFAYGNFGSAVAGTQDGVNRRAFLEQRIHSLIRERQGMLAFVPTNERAVEDAKAAVARECVKVGPECRKREGELSEANRYLGLTVRSGKIADELREAETELQGIQVVATSDPLTDGVIDLVYQTSGARWDARKVTTGRNVIFALFLLVPAGFFRGAASLARR